MRGPAKNAGKWLLSENLRRASVQEAVTWLSVEPEDQLGRLWRFFSLGKCPTFTRKKLMELRVSDAVILREFVTLLGCV